MAPLGVNAATAPRSHRVMQRNYCTYNNAPSSYGQETALERLYCNPPSILAWSVVLTHFSRRDRNKKKFSLSRSPNLQPWSHFLSFLFSFFFFLLSARKRTKNLACFRCTQGKRFLTCLDRASSSSFLSLPFLGNYFIPLRTTTSLAGASGRSEGKNGIFTWEREALGRKKSERETEERKREEEKRKRAFLSVSSFSISPWGRC